MKFTWCRYGMHAISAASVGVIGLVGAALPASAAPVDVGYDCRANAPLIGARFTTLTQAVDASAPATVAPGGSLTVVVDPAPNAVPAQVAGFQVREVRNFSLKIPVPTNATHVSTTLSGGSGLGATPPTVTVSGGIATISFPGPIAGGAAFELPTVTAELVAGASGTIDSSLYGTSYDDPGLTFTTVVRTFLGSINAPTQCFPNPNPTLTSTAIA